MSDNENVNLGFQTEAKKENISETASKPKSEVVFQITWGEMSDSDSNSNESGEDSGEDSE
eukprot:CAMPEP_0116897124 /NCGR_PEP_ID=MMETSP0467-20121206/6208_1 /TAXON_ID=283647 /ORGANISM="Mesodinium pulex, Strain SPMC105" /LENGTH=59 /DNA_ID=CAMNT_0004568661 /DNA_START=341 /DNA_END=520 /DNA_ORIENTATION=+